MRGIVGRARAALARELPAATELRHRLHRIAEVSHGEDKTLQALVDALGGRRAERVAGKSLLVRGAPDGPPGIVLRAEMDGLPLEEDTGVAFASPTGVMHACGHDVHMAALVAAYRVLETLSGDVGVPVSALFQHSEEAYPSGAREVVESGALTDASAVIAAHVHPDVARGAVAVDEGPVNASADAFHIVVRGAAGHAAYPHRARDAIAALCQIVVTLEQVASRSIDPLHGSVLSVGLVSGGSAHNALPGSAEASGTLRTLVAGDRPKMRSLVTDVAEGVGRAFGCEASVDITTGEPALVNDHSLVAAARAELSAFDLELAGPLRSCGADDFGYFSQAHPTVMTFVGVGGALHEPGVGLHHPRFHPLDSTIETVARAQLAASWAAAEHLRRRGEAAGEAMTGARGDRSREEGHVVG